MSYATDEAKGAPPLELYRFVVPTTVPQVFTYTTGDRPVTFDAGSGSETYAPVEIKRDALSANQESTKIQANVSLAVSVPVAALFVNGAAPILVACTIYRFHRGADISGGLTGGQVVTSWPGTVAGCSRKGAEATLAVVPAQRVIQDAVPRFRIQQQCNHVFCDAGCTLLEADFTQTGTVSSITGNGLSIGITLSTAALALGKYAGGKLTSGDSYVFVEQHTGSSGDDATIGLLVPLLGLAVSDTVSLLRGCDRSYPTCVGDFANGAHHFGFPYVLASDPWTNGLATVTTDG